jgi:hypothetical protein
MTDDVCVCVCIHISHTKNEPVNLADLINLCRKEILPPCTTDTIGTTTAEQSAEQTQFICCIFDDFVSNSSLRVYHVIWYVYYVNKGKSVHVKAMRVYAGECTRPQILHFAVENVSVVFHISEPLSFFVTHKIRGLMGPKPCCEFWSWKNIFFWQELN